jgi:L-lactate utilization protein LutC
VVRAHTREPDVVTPSATDAFRSALEANSVTVHGPLDAEAAARVVVMCAVDTSGDAPVALSPGDLLVAELGLVDRLTAAGVEVLLPDDPDWRERLPTAGVGVTGARLAVAETGSLALFAGPGSPRGVSLLVPVHVCLVSTADIVATFADAITRVAAEPLPSALTWVGGPSRTGDLEMITTLGVHGPRAVEVILVEP